MAARTSGMAVEPRYDAEPQAAGDARDYSPEKLEYFSKFSSFWIKNFLAQDELRGHSCVDAGSTAVLGLGPKNLLRAFIDSHFRSIAMRPIPKP